MSDQKAKPKIKRKSFSYLNEIEWEEPRVGSLRADEKPEIRFSSPPEFKGEAGNWTPEDFFVAAINTCTMTTFGDFSSKLDLPVRSYSSSAEGLLEFADGG